MIKHHYYQILFFLSTILAVPLHATQNNDSQVSALALDSNVEIDHQQHLKALENEEGRLRKALDTNMKIHGNNYPKTAITKENLGIVLFHEGEYQKATTYYEEALNG